MSTVAVLGTGLLGTGFADNLLDKDHTVHVWNRTASRTEPLVERGAVAFPEADVAVRDVERVHLVLTADDAVDAVIDQLRGGLSPDTPVIDHSTNHPERVAERYTRLRAEGIHYVPAPVFMSPKNARTATGIMLASGPLHEIEDLKPALEEMTGSLRVLSDRPEHAAILKLVGNGMLFVLTAGVGDLFRLAIENGLAPDDVIGLFEGFQPSPAYLGKRTMRAGDGNASFELSMALKDAQLMIDASGGAEGLTVLPAIREAMQAALDSGQGREDFAIFARPGDAPEA